MRLLLDEHDVRAIAEEPGLTGIDDPEVLALAARDERILVTFNHRDFAPLLRHWAESGRHHSGCIVVFGIDHGAIGLVLRSLDLLLGERPQAAAWRDITEALTRARLA
jgi:Domain of unknown function (DUF5615)